jgi:hypothetical protein
MSGPAATLETQVALLQDNLQNMKEMLHDLKEITNSLYTKVVAGNGEKSLVTRLELLEAHVGVQDEKHSRCPAPSKVDQLGKDMGEVRSIVHDVEEKFNVLMDDDQFRRRKWFGFGVDLLRMVAFAVVSSGIAYIVTMKQLSTSTGYDRYNTPQEQEIEQ